MQTLLHIIIVAVAALSHFPTFLQDVSRYLWRVLICRCTKCLSSNLDLDLEMELFEVTAKVPVTQRLIHSQLSLKATIKRCHLLYSSPTKKRLCLRNSASKAHKMKFMWEQSS
ncbi:hypothetical protein vseg_016438 [Gypsophila vaccaria]